MSEKIQSLLQEEDRQELQARKILRKVLGPIAAPAELEFAAKLPKARSGKVMRHVSKAQELGLDPGDVGTIEE